MITLVVAAVSLLGGWYLHKVKTEDSLLERKAAKYETFVEILFAIDEWMNRFESSKIFNEPSEGPNPSSRAHAIARIYFPDLLPQLSKLDFAILQYRSDVFEICRNKLDVASRVEEVKPKWRVYRLVFFEVEDAVSKLAQSEFSRYRTKSNRSMLTRLAEAWRVLRD